MCLAVLKQKLLCGSLFGLLGFSSLTWPNAILVCLHLNLGQILKYLSFLFHRTITSVAGLHFAQSSREFSIADFDLLYRIPNNKHTHTQCSGFSSRFRVGRRFLSEASFFHKKLCVGTFYHIFIIASTGEAQSTDAQHSTAAQLTAQHSTESIWNLEVLYFIFMLYSGREIRDKLCYSLATISKSDNLTEEYHWFPKKSGECRWTTEGGAP